MDSTNSNDLIVSNDNFDVLKYASENLFDYCQINDNVENKFSELRNYCLNNSLDLNQILIQLDASVFYVKFVENSFFKFDQLLLFCQNYYFTNVKGLKSICGTFFHKCWTLNQHFQLDLIKYCIENNWINRIFVLDIEISEEIRDLLKCELSDNTICWRCSVLYRILFQLSENLHSKIEKMLEVPLEKHPDFLITYLVNPAEAINFENSKFARSILIKAINKVIYPILPTLNNSFQIISQLWKKDDKKHRKVILESMVELYNSASSTDQTSKLLRILEIAQDLKCLNELLNEPSYLFVIDLASVASRREYLKLDKWIISKLSLIGKPFSDACKTYLEQRFWESDSGSKVRTTAHVETLSIIVSCLHNHLNMNNNNPFSSDMKDMLKYHAELESKNFYFNSKENMENNNNENEVQEKINLHGVFSKEIQEKADACLRNILSQISADNSLIEMVFDYFKRINSNNDNQLFLCIVENLMKELDYLTQYQENELSIIGDLIGGIINLKLIETNELSIILQKIYYIFNASKKDKKLSCFVNRAIERCRNRLMQEYPILYEKLISHGCIEVKKLSQPIVQQNPSEYEFKERLNFTFNNLDVNNVNSIATELKKSCENETFTQLFTELLTNRAIIEANHHDLFYQLLEFIDISTLYESIILKSYDKIKHYLLKIEFDDQKKRLYSAGQWLGMITLQRNKPILSIHLNLHYLILEAKNKKMCLYIVPFVVRILNSCAQSKIFKPPNPWLMSLLKYLLDIYNIPDEKFKIKFEIESLYKNLELDINNLDMNLPVINFNPKFQVEYLKPEIINDDQSNVDETKLNEFSSPSQIVVNFKNLFQNIKISPQVHPNFVNHIKTGIIQIIENLISTWSEDLWMLVNSAEFLIKKDFILESNPKLLRKSAVNYTQTILYGYFDNKCRSSMEDTIFNKIFALSKQLCPQLNEKNIEIFAKKIVNDNIELCINFVRKLLVERGTEEILLKLNPNIEKRLNAIANQDKYYDTNVEGENLKYDYIAEHPEFNIYNNIVINKLPPISNNNNQTNQDISSLTDEHGIINSKEFLQKMAANINDLDFEQKKQKYLMWCQYFGSHPKNFELLADELMKLGFFQNDDHLYLFFGKYFDISYNQSKTIISNEIKNYEDLYLSHLCSFNYLDSFTTLFVNTIKSSTFEVKMKFVERLFDYTICHMRQFKEEIRPVLYYRVFVIIYLEFFNGIQAYIDRCFKEKTLTEKIFSLKLTFLRVIFKFLKLSAPNNIPLFSFAWLEFMSHRCFIGNCLSKDYFPKLESQLWEFYFDLLKDLFEFERPFLQAVNEKSVSFNHLYKGTLKLLLLLYHDFPEFLTNFAFVICDNLPYNSFQFRNIILSAMPGSISLPDPHSKDIVLDDFLYPFIGEYSSSSPFKMDINVYFKTGNISFLDKLLTYFENQDSRVQIDYINRILFCITDYVLQYNINIDMDDIPKQPPIYMLKHLIENFNIECRYYLFTSMLNHLRYPNIETKYFIYLLLYISNEFYSCKEFILRVILERFRSRGPRPWALDYIYCEITQKLGIMSKEDGVNNKFSIADKMLNV